MLLLTTAPEHRSGYHRLFERREVEKTYLAVAPVRPGLRLPRTVRSRITKTPGRLQAQETDGPVNAETEVELLAVHGDVGLYLLRPRTGRTHQLRLHLSSLGIPVVGDPLYPTVRPGAACEPGTPDGVPLQLLARALELTDPMTGQPHCFVSRRGLAGWSGLWPGPSGQGWAPGSLTGRR